MSRNFVNCRILSLAIPSRERAVRSLVFFYISKKEGLVLSNELYVKSSDRFISRRSRVPIRREEENESRDENLFRDITNSSPRRITDWLWVTRRYSISRKWIPVAIRSDSPNFHLYPQLLGSIPETPTCISGGTTTQL